MRKWLRRRWWLKIPVLSLVGLLLIKVLWAGLFWTGAVTSTDLAARRAYLLRHAGADLAAMPAGLPAQFKGEWALISDSMTALALANMAAAPGRGTGAETETEALAGVERILAVMLSEERRAFDADRWGSDPLASLGTDESHIGYLGHLNLTLAAYHYLGGDRPVYLQLHHDVSAHLAAVLRASPSFNALTYPGETYVPDNAAVVASLAMYDRAFPEWATGVPAEWVAFMEANYVDAATGLYPFSLRSNGAVLLPPRGSGSSWDIFFLTYIDPALAAAQDKLLTEHFYDRLLPGVAGVHEWPGGGGWGDVDSGPLVLGFSPSATGFALAGAAQRGDGGRYPELLFTAELAGFSVPDGQGGVHYALAPLVGDAVLLAMRTVTIWPEN